MIDLLKKYDKFVAIEREATSKQVRFYNSRIGVLKEWNVKNMIIYIYRNGKLLSVSIEDPNENKIRRMLDKAEDVFNYLSQAPFEIGENRNYTNNKIFDESVVDDEKLLDKANEAINGAIKEAKEVAGVLYGTIEKIKVYNSKGITCEDKNSTAYLSLRAMNDDASAHAVSCSRRLDAIDTKAGREAAEIAADVKDAKKVEERKYDVLFTPLSFADLVSNLGNFSSAFAIDAGYSFLADKIGKKVANECITLYDSGVERDGIFSRKFDDEGVATAKTKIIGNGVLKTYLHNGTTAMLHNAKTTGNAGIVAPHPWNLIIESGDWKKEEMIEEIKEGLLITNVWYTRFQNYRNGDFSTVARDAAFYIKNGEIEHAVKGIRISDNLQRIFENITALSKEIRQIYWWEVENPVFTPYALAKNVRITTS
ncbi:MAG: TldD/PmbA family protein [Thermoplasmata archaeon]|nr:MAG: TldD/PmbA family protein [Thermoplasmata archaeon]